jgi:hypothetical protein
VEPAAAGEVGALRWRLRERARRGPMRRGGHLDERDDKRLVARREDAHREPVERTGPKLDA